MQLNLPIYDNIQSILTKQEEEIPITDEIKSTLINNINEYTCTHELLFAIIRYYQLSNSNNISTLPFYCKYLKTKKGYKFDIANLPDKLIRIMVEFYNLHIKSITNT